MKRLITTLTVLLAFMAAVSFITMPAYGASTVCPPVESPDSVAVTVGCAGLGIQPFAISNSQWLIKWNDNPVSQGIGPNGGAGDGDFNDIEVMLRVDASGFITTMTWLAGASAWDNGVGIYGIPYVSNSSHPFPVPMVTSPNNVIPLEEFTQMGNYAIGWNGNMTSNWTVRLEDYCAPMPEPGTWAMLSMSLLFITWGKMRLRKPTPQ